MPKAKFLEATIDVAFELLFGSEANKELLINFLNCILQNHNGKIVEDLTYLPILQSEGPRNKTSIVDVLCRIEGGEKIIIEMQLGATRIRNCSQYKRLEPVVVISICNYVLGHQGKSCVSHEFPVDEVVSGRDLHAISFIFVELPNLLVKNVNELANASMLDRWLYFLLNSNGTDEDSIDVISGGNEFIKIAFEVVNKVNWSKSQMDSYYLSLKRDANFHMAFAHEISITFLAVAKKLCVDGLSLERVREIFEFDDKEMLQLRNMLL